MLDVFDGQFSDDVSKLSKLKKKVVSRSLAALVVGNDGMKIIWRICVL